MENLEVISNQIRSFYFPNMWCRLNTTQMPHQGTIHGLALFDSNVNSWDVFSMGLLFRRWLAVLKRISWWSDFTFYGTEAALMWKLSNFHCTLFPVLASVISNLHSNVGNVGPVTKKHTLSCGGCATTPLPVYRHPLYGIYTPWDFDYKSTKMMIW